MARTMTQQLTKAVEAATTPHQYTLSTRAGCECIAHVLQGSYRFVVLPFVRSFTESLWSISGSTPWGQCTAPPKAKGETKGTRRCHCSSSLGNTTLWMQCIEDSTSVNGCSRIWTMFTWSHVLTASPQCVPFRRKNYGGTSEFAIHVLLDRLLLQRGTRHDSRHFHQLFRTLRMTPVFHEFHLLVHHLRHRYIEDLHEG